MRDVESRPILRRQEERFQWTIENQKITEKI